MEDTRTALTGKLERLEDKVTSTVEGAAEAVTSTVESVKDAVQGTVESVKGAVEGTVDTVKETFDLPLQVERHPWVMLGGSVALGFVLGRLLASASRPRAPASAAPVAKPSKNHGNGLHTARHHAKSRPAAQPSWLASITQSLGPEMDKLKGLAIGTTLGLVRDMVSDMVPAKLAPKITEIVDDVTAKLGGQKIDGPVIGQGGVQPSGGMAPHQPAAGASSWPGDRGSGSLEHR
jgi:ElaB/YqjD/DUF883 family membrane-anchored ribosome-binding protein